MKTETIFEDNINEYSEYVDSDVAENMVRIYYRGLAGHDPDDDSLLSLLIWELKSIENTMDTKSELKWIYAIDPSYIAPIMESYHREAIGEDVKKTVFESTSLEKEKEDALSDCGFSIKHVESRDITVTLDECSALPIAKKKAPGYVQSIQGLDTQEFYQGIMNILFKYDDPALEDIAFLSKDWYEQLVSCYIKTDGKITGYLLLHASSCGQLTPVLFFSVGADSRMNLIEMLRFSIRRAAQIYPGDTIIRIHRRNNSVHALSEKFFPGKKGVPAVIGERTEQE